MPIRANALVVMAKAPIPGLVKTRLVPFLSIDEAAELARALLIDQLNHLKEISTADLFLAFTPPETGPLMRELAPSEFALFSQTDGDLGARMQNVFATVFAMNYHRIVLIGSDLPPVPLPFLNQAFCYLDGVEPRVVLGPTRDGGYYLVGLNQERSEIFTNMTWSNDQVLARTLATLAALNVETHQLPAWFDIDTPDDVRRLLVQRAAYENHTENTFALLDRLELSQRPFGETLLGQPKR